MPRIDSNIIESTFYLYKDSADAHQGRNAKGTGFAIVHRGNRAPDAKRWYHIYAVTNQHVASQYPVVRPNRGSGVEICDFSPEDSDFHPNGDDVAVVPLGLPIDGRHRVYPGSLKAISTEMFAKKPYGTLRATVGVGDDVFMVGLFVDHEGRERNNPLARFGNISMLANEQSKVMRTTGDGRRIAQLSYVVDMHSRAGFSGSPVFAYKTLGSDLTRDGEESVEISTQNFPHVERDSRLSSVSFDAVIRARPELILLGVHWGQFPERYSLQSATQPDNEAHDPSKVVAPATYVAGYSGMTLVVPAWKIKEVLELPTLVDRRGLAEADIRSGKGSGDISG